MSSIHEINTGLIFTPIVFIQCKKSIPAGVDVPRIVNFDIPPLSFTVQNQPPKVFCRKRYF